MMNESEDELYISAVKYLRRVSMKHDEWKFTRIGELHSELDQRLKLPPGERTIVSSLVESGNWYVFTTRRVVAGFGGLVQTIDAIDVEGESFGNFKGHTSKNGPGSQVTEVGIVRSRRTGAELQIEFETLYASMAPIYACKFFMRRAKRQRAERHATHVGHSDS